MRAFIQLIAFLFVLIFPHLMVSQVPAWNWSTGWASDGNETGRGVYVDSAGFTYQVGSFTGSLISLPTLSATANTGTVGSSDIFISKIDRFGIPVWQVKAGGTGNDIAYCVTADNNGNVYVGGSTGSSNCIFYGSPNISLNAGSSTDFFVAKYNSSGSVLWVKTSSGSGNEEILSIATDNTHVYAGGYFLPNLTIPSLGSVSSNGGEDMLILKYDLSGNIIWAKSEGGSGNDRCKGIICDQANVYICGTAATGITYNGTPNIVKSAIGVVGTDITLAKLNSNGDVLWAQLEGNANNCSANSISIVKNTVIVGGSYIGALTYSSSALSSSSGNEMFFAEYDRNGIYKGAWSAATAGEEVIYGVTTDFRFVYVSGQYANTVNFGGTNGVATSTSNLFVACYDTLFNLQFVKLSLGASLNRAFAGHANKNGIVSLTGTFSGNNIQFPPLSAITPSLTDDFYVASLSNCPGVSNNTITNDQIICSGTVPSSLSVSTPTGGNGSYYYLWEQSANTTTWVAASGTNTLINYSVPSLTQTTYYRRIVNSCVETSTSNIVTITVTPLPTAANAGSDQLNLCGVTTTTLSGNIPAVGNGSWTVISGAGGSFLSAITGSTTFSGIASTSYVLRWTISNSTCTPSFDDVNITFNPNPTVANAGLDQLNLCGITSATLGGNTAAIGTGSWTVISGAGGSFVSATNPTTTFNGLVANSYTLRWTISNAPCTASFDDVTITFNQNPTTSAAGSDQLNLCGVTSTTLAGNTAAIGTGSWTVISGAGGSFVSATNPTTTFNGVAGNSYTLRWTISNAPCTSSFDDVSITFNQNPTTSAAGSDQLNLCGVTSTTLAGNTAAIGTGSWTVISGAGGSFVSATNPTTTFIGVAGNSYTLRWTISNAPCGTSFDDVNITFNQNPTTSAAGTDQLNLCGVTSTTLAGNTAAVGTGSWTIISGAGGSFASATNPTTIFNGAATTTYVLRWTISNLPCAASFDDMSITFNQNPTTSAAGSDQLNLCGVTSTTLAGNTAAIGTGSWTIISGIGGSFVSSTNPTTAFNGVAGNSYTLRWTISNSPCTSSFDDVGITFNQNPTTSAAGSDQLNLCGVTSTSLAGNTAAIGTGSWTIISGAGGNFASAVAPTTIFNGVAGNSYTLRWTISNAPCATSFDDVNITFNQNPTVANAGLDQPNLCVVTSATLGGNIATVGTGSWTVISGAGGSFLNAVNPTSLFNGISGTSYVLRWTISNSPCADSFDDVSIVFNQNPTAANAGSDQLNLCGVTSATLGGNIATVGTGSWTVISGVGGSFLNTANPTTSFNGTSGTSYVLRWTTSNAPCSDSFDDVNVAFPQNPTVAGAGSDQTNLCGVITTSLSANLPVIGTGSWTIISGAGGSFVNSGASSTTFNGIAGVAYLLRWTISNPPCTDSFDEINITFNQNPTIANAGSNQTVCANTVILSANPATIGTGFWTVLSGTNGSFVNASDPTTVFNGEPGTQYVLRWTISNPPCTDSFENVNVTLNQGPTSAKLGVDQIVCSKTISLVANTPVVGSGQWRRISGTGNFVSVNTPTAFIEDLGIGSNKFAWEITNLDCPVSSDTIGVFVDEFPTPAEAGSDLETGVEVITLQANSPTSGTGQWSILSGEGTFADVNSPNTTFTFFSESKAYILWSVRNGVCPVSADTIIVERQGLFIPELITPNDDGNNDNLVINATKYIDDIKIEIFNRWGGLVYKNTNYKNEFKGKSNLDEELPDDTYFLILSIPNNKTRTGYFIIKRR